MVTSVYKCNPPSVKCKLLWVILLWYLIIKEYLSSYSIFHVQTIILFFFNRTRGKTERSSPPASSETTSTTEEKSGGGLPTWVKLVVLLLVAFFVYLVIVNMEPSADEKIPKSITEGTWSVNITLWTVTLFKMYM